MLSILKCLCIPVGLWWMSSLNSAVSCAGVHGSGTNAETGVEGSAVVAALAWEGVEAGGGLAAAVVAGDVRCFFFGGAMSALRVDGSRGTDTVYRPERRRGGRMGR